MPAVQALVPRALSVQSEHRTLAAIRAVPDHMAGRRPVLPGVAVPLQRPEVLLVQQLIFKLVRELCHGSPPFVVGRMFPSQPFPLTAPPETDWHHPRLRAPE